MITSAKELFDYSIQALDGEIGSVHDVIFDENDWSIRYIVVSTGVWLLGRKVLLHPTCIAGPLQTKEQLLPVDLTRAQVKDSPDMAVDLPLSREQEVEYHDYYRWPYYWGGGVTGAYGVGVAPAATIIGDTKLTPEPEIPADKRDVTLRSARDVFGFKVLEAGGDEIGTLLDLGIDLEQAQVPLLVVKGDLSDEELILAPSDAAVFGYPEEDLRLALDRRAFEGAPFLKKDDRLTDGLVKATERHFAGSRIN